MGAGALMTKPLSAFIRLLVESPFLKPSRQKTTGRATRSVEKSNVQYLKKLSFEQPFERRFSNPRDVKHLIVLTFQIT
jgi:hypothetical protein